MKAVLYVFLTCFLFQFTFSQHTLSTVEPVATISIAAVDTVSGDIGIAIVSRILAVGAIAPYAQAGVGAVVTQAMANTTYGPVGLEMLSRNLFPWDIVPAMLSNDGDTSQRQVGIVDVHGNSFAFTGSGCVQKAAHMFGPGYTVQGNILSSQSIITVIARTFELSKGALSDRLLEAIEAGERASGEDRKSTRLNSSHSAKSRMPSSA